MEGGRGGNAKRGEGRKQKGERKREEMWRTGREGERGSAAARLIAVDLHDKRSRQLVTKVALRH